VNKKCTDLFEIQRDCEEMSAARITRELRNLNVFVADEGDDTYIVVIPNRTHKGVAHILAQALHVHRLQMLLEGEPSVH